MTQATSDVTARHGGNHSDDDRRRSRRCGSWLPTRATRPWIASRTADELRGLGYSTVSATNAATVRPDTVVVFAPGFEAEAARLASQLQVPAERVTAQTDGPLTINDTPGDLWVLLGFDRS